MPAHACSEFQIFATYIGSSNHEEFKDCMHARNFNFLECRKFWIARMHICMQTSTPHSHACMHMQFENGCMHTCTSVLKLQRLNIENSRLHACTLARATKCPLSFVRCKKEECCQLPVSKAPDIPTRVTWPLFATVFPPQTPSS